MRASGARIPGLVLTAPQGTQIAMPKVKSPGRAVITYAPQTCMEVSLVVLQRSRHTEALKFNNQ